MGSAGDELALDQGGVTLLVVPQLLEVGECCLGLELLGVLLGAGRVDGVLHRDAIDVLIGFLDIVREVAMDASQVGFLDHVLAVVLLEQLCLLLVLGEDEQSGGQSIESVEHQMEVRDNEATEERVVIVLEIKDADKRVVVIPTPGVDDHRRRLGYDQVVGIVVDDFDGEVQDGWLVPQGRVLNQIPMPEGVVGVDALGVDGEFLRLDGLFIVGPGVGSEFVLHGVQDVHPDPPLLGVCLVGVRVGVHESEGRDLDVLRRMLCVIILHKKQMVT